MQHHTFLPELGSLTVRSVTFCWRVVLKDDWHESLTYSSLPSFGKLSSHPTIGRNTAGADGDGQTRHTRWRGRGGVGVFTNKVDHRTRHDLKAVGACARRDKREITCRADLKDFWERDLLWREAKGQIRPSIMQTICTKVNLKAGSWLMPMWVEIINWLNDTSNQVILHVKSPQWTTSLWKPYIMHYFMNPKYSCFICHCERIIHNVMWHIHTHINSFLMCNLAHNVHKRWEACFHHGMDGKK